MTALLLMRAQTANMKGYFDKLQDGQPKGEAMLDDMAGMIRQLLRDGVEINRILQEKAATLPQAEMTEYMELSQRIGHISRGSKNWVAFEQSREQLKRALEAAIPEDKPAFKGAKPVAAPGLRFKRKI